VYFSFGGFFLPIQLHAARRKLDAAIDTKKKGTRRKTIHACFERSAVILKNTFRLTGLSRAIRAEGHRLESNEELPRFAISSKTPDYDHPFEEYRRDTSRKRLAAFFKYVNRSNTNPEEGKDILTLPIDGDKPRLSFAS